jgi:hypothetical protein
LSDSDCQGRVVAASIPIGQGCSVSKCVKGTCQTTQQICSQLQTCCPPYGCQVSCNVATQ